MKKYYYRSMEDLAEESGEVAAELPPSPLPLEQAEAAAEYAFEGYVIDLNEKIMLTPLK